MEKAPKWFMPVAVLALLWNLAGCVMYLQEVFLSAADVARMSAAEQAYFAARPAWALGGYAMAVWLGAAGCVVLILHRSWAMPLLLLSLLGLIVHDVFMFGMTPGIHIPGWVYLMQAVILLVAVGLVWMTRVGTRNNWLYSRA